MAITSEKRFLAAFDMGFRHAESITMGGRGTIFELAAFFNKKCLKEKSHTARFEPVTVALKK